MRSSVVTPGLSDRRYEVKLVLSAQERYAVGSLLRTHPLGFSSAYPERQVNNVYFDTPDLGSVHDNLAGISQRQKLRLRWYGPLEYIESSTWEIKRKQGGLGWKLSHPAITNVHLTAFTWKDLLALLHRSTDDLTEAHFRRTPWPTLINSYQRQYLESRDHHVRITLDRAQRCYDQRLSSYPNLSRLIPMADTAVVEVKASLEDYDLIIETLNYLPFRLARNSKYVAAMLSSFS